MNADEKAKQRSVLNGLRRDANVLAKRFGLRLVAVDAERASVKRRYGVCYSDGTIRIRLRHASTSRLLKYSGLVDTLCHELAHLRHFNHGQRFQALYRKILEDARAIGIYRPTPRSLEGDRREGLAIRVSKSAIPTHARSARRPVPREKPVSAQLELF